MAKIVKVIELMSESPEELGGRVSERCQGSGKDAAEHPVGIHQRIHRGGRE
jgi:hypothetical protein